MWDFAVPLVYAFGPFRLDAQASMLYRGAEPVALGRRAVVLLRVLLERPGALVSKEALIAAAWPGLAIEDSNLTVQIAALRRALGAEPGGERWIETLPRRGYRFVGPVVTREDYEGVTGRQPAASSTPAPASPAPPIPLDGRLSVVGSDTVQSAESSCADGDDRTRDQLALKDEGDGSGPAVQPAPGGAYVRRSAMLLLVAVAVLGAFWLSSHRGHQTLVGAKTGAVVPASPAPTSVLAIPVAVLPFTSSLGAPPSGLGERIAHDLATHLPRTGALRVVPSQGLSDATLDYTVIGAKLGVRYLVSGTISAQDEKLRVSVALIDARSGGQAWALHATEDRGQWLAVHDEFIHRATFAIHFQAMRRAGNEPIDPAKEPTISQLLGRGQAGLMDSSDSPRFEEARAAFAEVLRREPEFCTRHGRARDVLSSGGGGPENRP